MIDPMLLSWPCARLVTQYPYVSDFFAAQGLSSPAGMKTVQAFLSGFPVARLEALGLDEKQLDERFLVFLERMEVSRQGRSSSMQCLTVMGGRNKVGLSEDIRLDLHPGEIVALVGPTGAGKSQLLSDIECLAQGDTPSGRRILIDNRIPEEALRLSGEGRLVAQLSQNMNFVMDVSVQEFIAMHAESRLIEDIDAVVDKVFDVAVGLAGEPFGLDTQVTALSGGQSRALMIADTACLSTSPVVLIDEIENAGVDRRRALDLLVKKEKIVLMATHDPLLALFGNRRLVIRNGGIAAVMDTSLDEQNILKRLEAVDARIVLLRNRLREGGRLDAELFESPDLRLLGDDMMAAQDACVRKGKAVCL